MLTDDLVRPLKVVSVHDPAIDWVAMARGGVTARTYAATRDEASVRELPGRSAQWCILRALSGSDCMWIDGAPSDAAKMWRSFSMAVAEVQNLETQGIALGPTLPAPAAGGSRLVWDDPGIERVATVLGMQFIYEMGELAYARALAGNGRSGGVLFTPPRFLELALDQIVRRSAALLMADDGIRSNASSAQGAPTTSSPSSAARTDVRAASGGAPPAASTGTTSSATPARRSSARSKKRRGNG